MKFLDVPQSGSIAGTVHSHNRAGQYTRNRRAPVQPIGTGRRAQVRAAFSAATSGYAVLTEAQRAAWTSFSAVHPITDSLGQTVILTGQQMYVRVSATLANIGKTFSATPPAGGSPPDVTPITLAASVVSGLSLGFTAGVAGQTVAVAVSQPVSPGRMFWKTFWQPMAGNGYIDAAAGPWLLTSSVYNAQFGAPVIGKRIFARVTPVSADGFNGPPVIVSALVTA